MSDDPYTIPDVGDAPSAAPKGRKKKAAGAGVYVDPKVEDCPVIPLGFDGGKVWFALPEGELRCEHASKISGMLRTDIFVSVAGQAFLANWRDPDDEFKAQAATIWFNRACRAAGKWDANRPQRGYGLWPSADGPVLHVGDAVGRWPFGKSDWTPIADALRGTGSRAIWLLRPPTPRPGKPATIADGEALRDHLKKWRFAAMGAGGLSEADALLGWQGVAWLGAVPGFRPHISVSGGAGTGKTTLSRLMQAVGSANGGELLDTFTDAGIRNSLSGEARGLYLDEAEPSADGAGPVERVMEVLRRMSTGDGSSGRKGDIGGKSVNTSAIGAAYLASIFPVALGDAMATRMVEVRLRPLGKAKGGADEDLKAAIDWARETSPAFLSRAIREAGRFKADVAVMKTALGEAGQMPRGADLVAALAAGRRMLLFDQALTIETARDEVTLWSALIRGREETSAAQNPGQGCLSRIWAINSGQHVRDRHLTIGEMVTEEMQSVGFHEKVLKTFGLKVENGHAGGERPGPWLIVSTNHPHLARQLAGTEYSNWRGVLEHLGDLGEAYAPRHLGSAVRFGMHQSRAIAVPLTPWLDKPVVVGVDPKAATPFDAPDWDARFSGASQPASHSASQGESHD